MTRRNACILALVLTLAGVAARADEIDDYLRDVMEQQHIPGASVAVIRDGALVKAAGYGLADIEHAVPVRPDTVFKIGSVSKQFIAAGIMLLVQEGKLALDDAVSKRLPGAPKSWEAITLRRLLTHTAGLAREAPGFDPHKQQPDLDVIQTAYALPLRFQPGEKWEYSNLGYFVLAEIIHQTSGKPWADFLNERIFTPLEMTATRATTLPDIVPNRAHGYSWAEGKFRNAGEWPAVRPSGAFLSTVNDLAKWEAALLADRIFTGATKQSMWTRVALNGSRTYPYGFGWQLDDWPADSKVPTGVPMIRHAGSMPGFRAGYSRWPRQGLAVVVLTNRDNVPIDALMANIAVRAAPELKTAPTAESAAGRR